MSAAINSVNKYYTASTCTTSQATTDTLPRVTALPRCGASLELDRVDGARVDRAAHVGAALRLGHLLAEVLALDGVARHRLLLLRHTCLILSVRKLAFMRCSFRAWAIA